MGVRTRTTSVSESNNCKDPFIIANPRRLRINQPSLGWSPDAYEACADTEILINSAGAISGGNIDAIDEARWRAAWDLKVFGYVNMTRRFYALMRERKVTVR
jgi:NAD(P)-dependent dehydrogenase (short-subunit alcohol dehydrogenase family)